MADTQATSEMASLESKCIAIQYGVIVAGAIVLVILTFNWFQTYGERNVPHCGEHRRRVVYYPQDNNASYFAGKPATPVKRAVPPQPKRDAPVGQINENRLASGRIQESFLSGRPDFDRNEFDQSYYGIPQVQDPNVEEFDPAKMSLEKSVFDSHKDFVDEAYINSQGPTSLNIERDDVQDINPRWGLRRTDYSTVQPDATARVTTSEYADQMAPADKGSIVL